MLYPFTSSSSLACFKLWTVPSRYCGVGWQIRDQIISHHASTEQLLHRALGHLLYRHDLTYHEKCDAACTSSINTNDTRLTRLTFLRRHGGPQLRRLQPGPQPASCRYVHRLATFLKSLLLTTVSDHTRPAHLQHRSLRTLKPDLRRRHIASRAALLHIPRRPNPHTAPTPHRQHQGTL